MLFSTIKISVLIGHQISVLNGHQISVLIDHFKVSPKKRNLQPKVVLQTYIDALKAFDY